MTAPVYVLHDNPDWIGPFAAAFDAEGVELRDWLLDGGTVDLSAEPPAGVYWSRFSASAHTRGRDATKEYGRAVLRWLESWGRTVVNGSPVLELEVSKAAQHAALRGAGIDVPRTVAVFGRAGIVDAAAGFSAPFITKHDQGGKGLGVRRWDSHADLAAWVTSDAFEPSPNDVTLVQEHLEASAPLVTRVEFVGGEFLYAVAVDTSSGAFELCPAEACDVPDGPRFRRVAGFETDPLVSAYRAFLHAQGISIAGIEFIETTDGRRVTYDVNTNTNYNPDVERDADVSGARTVARTLGALG